MDFLRPNEQRGKIAMTMIWIVLIFDIVNIFVNGYLLMFYDRFDGGGFVSDTEVTIASILETYSGLLYLLAYGISGVTFIMWFRRAYYNLNQLTYNNLEHSDGWAAGCWFVPFINLYRPYKMMKEMYVKTDSFLYESDSLEYKKKLNTSYLSVWWTLWIISSFISNFSFRYSLDAETVSQLSNSSVIAIVEAIIGIPLALVTIIVIRDYYAVEPLLAEIGEQQNKQEIDTVVI